MRLLKLSESVGLTDDDEEYNRPRYENFGTIIPDDIKAIINKYLKWPSKKSVSQMSNEYHQIYAQVEEPDIMQDIYHINLVIRGIKPSSLVESHKISGAFEWSAYPGVSWFKDVLTDQVGYAKKHGLVSMKYDLNLPKGFEDEYIDTGHGDSYVVARQQNSDVFKIFQFTMNLDLSDRVKHLLQGIALGYPTDEVEKFCGVKIQELGLDIQSTQK